MSSKSKAAGVDQALKAIFTGEKIDLNAAFIKKWADKCKEFGGALSSSRIAKAFAKAKIQVIGISSCAIKYYRSAGWGSPTFS